MTLDFSGQNLRGRSFKGRKDLVGANFSYADIRGADFTNALLVEANFSQTQAGREPGWAIILLGISLLLSALSGLASAFVGVITGTALTRQDPIHVLAGVVVLITLAVFITVSIRQGLVIAIGVLVAVGVTAAAALGAAGAGSVVISALTAAAVAIAIAMVASAAGAGAGAGSAVVVAGAAAAASGMSVAIDSSGTTAEVGSVSAAVAVAVAMAAAGLSASVSWKALAGEKKYMFLRRLTNSFAAIGGSNFRGADLTDADFTQATLESTNFRRANLTRTCWFQAKKLSFACVGRTYLENEQVRQLVVIGEGEKQNFDNLSLRGINLRGANLVEASFVGADLSDANLQSANLSRAKLMQAHLDGADLTGAHLAGAWIEDWGITSETKFDKVQYEYVFKRLGKKRRPRPEPPQ
ncbi:pentapeptide repeat-containing protein [Allocoleopsis sp.]|uniref:pentapeptide repeat-containing protein n=1 Tax=Allocoleopsis sp. TaxID=3088169 RepID=UPI002FD56109